MASKGRKYLITINNPTEKGYTHDYIKQCMIKWGIEYWCMCDEIGGKTGTYHTHLYMYRSNAIWWQTVEKAFHGCGDIATCNGTSKQNRDYIRKEGKHLDTDKADTNLKETFEEFGELPVEQQGKRNDLNTLYQYIKDGKSNFEIMEENPNYMLNIDKIERARQIIKENQYKDSFRQLEVIYIWGVTGSGKTRGVMEKYGYSNVFRVTDYDHPFDSYKGQDVVVFEEFRSSLKVQDMLNYLDGYPLELPCRYSNQIACFTKVYIISNIDLRQQYELIQSEYPETFKALLRRINNVVQYTETEKIEKTVKEYFEISDKGTIFDDKKFDDGIILNNEQLQI